jgi:hypothetical protein
MAARARTTAGRDRPAAKAARTPDGRHVIDLTDTARTEDRSADYKAAFGPGSALHETPPPVPPPRGLACLRRRHGG